MNTKEALLQAIWNDPDDDVPRLVYADFLEETGKEIDVARAKFIRLSIESAKIDKSLRQWSEFPELEAKLWGKHKKEWLEGLPRWVSQYEPERGFVHQIACSPKEFLQDGAKVYDREPVFEVNCRSGSRKEVIRLASSDLLERVRSIHENSSLRDEENAILFESPHLKNLWSTKGFVSAQYCISKIANDPKFSSLRRLEFDYLPLDLGNLKTLCNSCTLTELISLRLTGNASDESAQLLSSSPITQNLKEFSFWGNQLHHMTAQGFQQWIQFGWGKKLVKLQFPCNRIGDEGLKNLPKTIRWPNLSLLNLTDNQITDEGLYSLGQFLPKGLVEVGLAGNPIRGEGIRLFLDSPAGQSLEHLSLWGCQINDEGLGFIASTSSTPPLKVLRLDMVRMTGGEVNNITAKGLKALVYSRLVENLHLLELFGNPIGDRGAISIAESPYLTNLWSLDLGNCGIGDQGIIALAQSKNLANLRQLQLSSNPISDEGVKALVKSPYFEKLTSIVIHNTALNTKAITSLTKRFKEVTV